MLKTAHTSLIDRFSEHLPSYVLLFVLSFPSLALAQRLIEGTVTNGTSGRPVTGQKVELLSIAQGMKLEHETITGPDGSFKFQAVEMGQSPHLIIRAIYKGVNYNAAIATAQETQVPVSLTVFDVTSEFKNITVTFPVMLLQANANSLLVQQQFFVNNQTNPEKTLLNPAGTFFFDTPPPGVTEQLVVAVVGLGGIPLPQTPAQKPGGGYAISYPMKPGLNEVHISYRMESSSPQREFSQRLFYPTGTSRILILPADLQLVGSGLKAIGRDERTQAAVYQISNLAPQGNLKLKVIGEAPPITDPQESSNDERSDDSQVKVVRLPNRVFEIREFIIGGLGAIFVFILVFAVRQRIRNVSATQKNAK